MKQVMSENNHKMYENYKWAIYNRQYNNGQHTLYI